MQMVEGRSDDFILLPSGTILSPLDASRCFESIEGVSEYRIIQEAKDHLTVQLVLKEGCGEDVPLRLRDKLKQELGENLTVDVQVLDAIPGNGKRRNVISKCLTREQFFSY